LARYRWWRQVGRPYVKIGLHYFVNYQGNVKIDVTIVNNSCFSPYLRCRVISSSISSVVARRKKCTRQPPSCLQLCQVFTNLILFFTGRLSNRPFLMWKLTLPPHLQLNYLLIFSLIASFLALIFHEVVWQYMQGMVGSLITTLLHIYQRILQWKDFENRLRFDWIMAMSLMRSFLTHPVSTSLL